MERGRFRKFWHSSTTRTASRRAGSGRALRAGAACHTEATTNEPSSRAVSSPSTPLGCRVGGGGGAGGGAGGAGGGARSGEGAGGGAGGAAGGCVRCLMSGGGRPRAGGGGVWGRRGARTGGLGPLEGGGAVGSS